MRHLPLVSILIPCYKQSHCVGAAIESARSQTYPHLEIIVSDDASPDDTAEVVAIHVAADPRVRYERAPVNLGRVGNYRRGVHELARGEWIINLDGDDSFGNPNYIERAMALALSEPNIHFVFGRQRYLFKDSGLLSERPAPHVRRINGGKELLLRYFDLNEGIPHLSALYKRSIALRAGLFQNDILFADAEAIVRLLPYGDVGYCGEFAGTWVAHDSNESAIPKLQSRLDSLKWITEPARFFLEQGILTRQEAGHWRRRGLRRAVREAMYFYLDTRNRRLALSFFLAAKERLSTLDRILLLADKRLWIRVIAPGFSEWLRRRRRTLS